MKDRFNKMSLGSKITLAMTGFVVVTMALFVIVITGYLISSMRAQMVKDVSDKVVLTVDMINVYSDRLNQQTKDMMRVFHASYPGDFSIDPTRTVMINGIATPALLNGDTTLNLNLKAPDEFTRVSGAVGTIFARSGSEFIRITTSLKKEDGARAIGTPLAHDHPAYAALTSGEGFTGKAVLFGRDYMTGYEPIRGRKGEVIGALFVGVDFSESLKALKDNIRKIKIGETGYMFILNAQAGKDYGVAVLHPTLEGQNAQGIQDAHGTAFMDEVLKNREGMVTYFWDNKDATKGELGTKEKTIICRYFKDWDWIVCGGSTYDELLTGAYHVRTLLIGASILLVLVMWFFVMLIVKRMVSRPLSESSEFLQRLRLGDFSAHMQTQRKDEIGVMAETMNALAETLNKVNGEVKNLSCAGMEGRLAARGNAAGFEGAYREIVQGVNSTLDSVVGPLNMAAEYVARIAKGDIPNKIAEEYNGDFNEIKNNLNTCIDAISLLVSDAHMLSGAAVEGRLSKRADAGRHHGDFRKIIEGVNATLDAVVEPITEAAQVLSRMAENDLSESITGEYKGDLGLIKDSINKVQETLQEVTATMQLIAMGDVGVSVTAKGGKDEISPALQQMLDTLRYLIDETNMLSQAGINGDLKVRGNAAKFQGAYREIVDGINATLDAVSRPLAEAALVLGRMSENDFTINMVQEYKGDHAVIKNNLNKVIVTLNGSLRKVADAAGQVAATTQELSSTAGQMASGSQRQTTQTAQVATSMEEMSATIQEVAKSSNAASSRAKEAGVNAAHGGEVVKQTLTGINRIEASVLELQEVITGLSHNSEKIGAIVGVIDDVADQTNLLALNAAIEAARAGEQGRGFAVVADEVRKLAERTISSTKEIASMVKTIQEATAKAVTSMDRSSREVKEGVGYASAAGKALEDILTGTQSLQDMVQQIATSAEEQAAAAEEISANVESISSVSKQNANGAGETARAAQELGSLTEDLQGLVKKFKLEG